MTLFKADIGIVRQAADAPELPRMLRDKLFDLATRMQQSYDKSVEDLVAETRRQRGRS